MDNNNLSELINCLKENCTKMGEIREPILNAISDVEDQLNSDLINLVFLGNFNDGKTTMINSIIGYITNKYDNVNLISNSSENTYFPTIIERSTDDYYYLTIIKSNISEEIKYSNPEEINKKLEELDDNSTTYLKDLQYYEQETDDHKKKELEGNIPEIVIKIKIPNFHPEFRLIDFPGLTNKTITERLFKLLNEKYIMSIFVYLRSFTQEKVISNTVIYEFFTKIKENYHNSIFCVCLTKYDLFVKNYLEGSKYYKPIQDPEIEREKNRDIKKLIENIQYFKKEMKEISNYINISKIFINDNKNVFNKSSNINEKPRKQIKYFLESIKKLKSDKGELIKRIYFIINMRIRLYNINQKYSVNEFLNDEEKNFLSRICEKTEVNFSDELRKWKKNFPLNYNNFKNKNETKLSTLKEMFYYNDNTILKEKKYFIRDNYIRKQFELLSPDMTNMIEDDLKKLMFNSYDQLVDKLTPSLKQKFKNLLLENCKYDDPNQQIMTLSKVILYGTVLDSLIGSQLVKGARYAIVSLLKTSECQATMAFFNGPPGWIIGGVIGVGCLVFCLSNYIGIWKRLDCFDSIIESFYNYTNKNLDKIIDISTEKYLRVVITFREILLNLKETISEIKRLHEILNRFYITRFNNIDESIEELFKKAFNNFEENTEIKLIFDELIFNNKL